jgi:hypothetical protein
LLLNQLLDDSDQYFRWIASLGQIRETRTALSGLFGRFVARAYLSRYFSYAYFDPIGSGDQSLTYWPALSVNRVKDGDLPDWVVGTRLIGPNIAIAEAKGSHNAAGAGPSLSAAVEQASRVEVVAAGTALAVKRYAIATRWAVCEAPKLYYPWLSVCDPAEGEREPNEEELASLRRGVALGHFANLANGLGAANTAHSLRRSKEQRPGTLAPDLVEFIEIEVAGVRRRVIGAIVTRSGIIRFPEQLPINFLDAIRTIYSAEAMVLVIDLDTLIKVDSDLNPIKAAHSGTPQTPSRPAPDYWLTPRPQPDGSELLPLDAVDILGRITRPTS